MEITDRRRMCAGLNLLRLWPLPNKGTGRVCSNSRSRATTISVAIRTRSTTPSTGKWEVVERVLLSVTAALYRAAEADCYTSQAIMCADTDHSKLNDTSVSTFHTYARELARISPTGAQWATWVGQCRHFKSAEKPSEVYRG